MSQENGSLGASTNQTDTLFAKMIYARCELGSAFTLAILSPVTVLANILLITAIFKDPLKYFKKPTSYFVLGLSVADLLCGLFVEPFFAMYFLGRYFLASEEFQAISQTLFLVGSMISTVSLNASFVMVLMLSLVQLIAIECPYRYKTWVTKKTVISCVLVTWLYFTVYSFLPILGLDQIVFFKLNLTLHSTLISVILAFVQICMYRAFRGRLQHHIITNRSLSRYDSTNSPHCSTGNKHTSRKPLRYRTFDRNFIIMTFYLAAILLFAAFPHIGVFYFFLYAETTNIQEELSLNILLRTTDLLLFTKVAADAFIFAWRLPSYRKSLEYLIRGKHYEVETGV